MMRSQTEQHGFRLSLITEQDSYPRNALIQVTVRIENVTGASIVLEQLRYWNPGVVVSNDDRVVSTSANPLLCPTGSIGPIHDHRFRLPPEAAIEQKLYVVLFAGWLRPFVRVSVLDGPSIIEGEDLVLDLYEAESPQATLNLGPPLSVDIEPPGAVDGPLLYRQCWDSRSGRWWARQWERVEGRRVVRDHAESSGEPGRWQVVAGWLNHPVATVEYTWSRRQG